MSLFPIAASTPAALVLPLPLQPLPELRRSESWLWLLSGCCFAFVLWAGFAPVQEVTQANGEIIPEGQLQVVQHLDGGMLRALWVTEGQLVEKDQPLLALDAAASGAPMAEQEEKVARLSDELATWQRLIAHQKDSVADSALLSSMRQSRGGERHMLEQQINQRRESLNAVQGQIGAARKQVDVARESLALQQTLVQKGLGTLPRLMERKQAMTAAEANLQQLLATVPTARAALQEAQAHLIGNDAQQNEEAEKEISRLTSELSIARSTLERLKTQQGRLIVRAPVAGLVQGLAVNTPGEVITAGKELLRILPSGRKLEVEARIPPTDIGQLHVGQEAQLRFQTYDFTRYGQMKGTLTALSPTTYAAPDGTPYYKARIALSDTGLPQTNGQTLPILPGMTVEASLLTGQKTVLAYLLKPIHRAMSSALQER